jgi:hypothetical protein
MPTNLRWLLVLTASLATSAVTDATLLVMIPFNNGLLVAADDRVLVDHLSIDGEQKLHVACDTTVFGVAGDLDTRTLTNDLQPYAIAPHTFDLIPPAQNYLCQNKESAITSWFMQDLGITLMVEINRLFEKDPEQRQHHAGRDFCALFVARYDAKTCQPILARMIIRISRAGTIIPEPAVTDIIDPTCHYPPRLLGAVDFVMHQVLTDQHRDAIPQDLLCAWDEATTPQQVSLRTALHIALTLITLTSQTAQQLHRPDIGVSPNAHVLLIDDHGIREIYPTPPPDLPGIIALSDKLLQTNACR